MFRFREFSFTAFSEADLSDGPIAPGVSFAVPDAPTLSISLTDNDRFLSGDSLFNEVATDPFGQHAAILSEGADIGTGGAIYAERVWTLDGSDGRTYYLVEVEQENGSDDYFTFLGDVPPAGVSITVTDSWNVRIGSRLDYDHLSAGPLPDPLPNIVDIAAGSDDFNLLVRALDTAGLTEAIQVADDITVFAPTDAAFAQLAVDLGFTGDSDDEDAVFTFIVDALTELGGGDPAPLLTDILLYHVSPEAKSAAEIDALEAIPTLLEGVTFGSEGTELIDNDPDIANPSIVAPDIEASNGTIQVIDRVLLPIDVPEPLPNIIEIASGSDDFNLLVRALETVGLTEVIRNSDDITVFAPTDAAFTQTALDLGFEGDTTDEDAVFQFLVDAFTEIGGGDPAPVLTDILLYHVSPEAKSAAEIDALETVPTLLEGTTFGSEGTELIDNDPDIANPSIVAPDIAAANGTIQGIDRVLLPIDVPEPLPNIVDIAAGSDDFNLLVRALETVGLTETIQTSDDITVFAPTDAAFTQTALDLGFEGDTTDEDAVFQFLVDILTELGGGDPAPVLTDILLYHVSPEAKSAAEIDALDAVPTLLEGTTFGSEGTELIDNDPDIANPSIVAPDIEAANGTIQGIDRVLLPIDVPEPEPLPNIVDIAAGSDDFNLLVRALDTAGLTETIQGSDDITVFAPTDAAFTQTAVDLGFEGDTTDEDAVFQFLVDVFTELGGGDPAPVLTDILLYHVSPEAKSAAEIDALDAVPTLLEGATFGSEGTELVDNEPDLENPDIVAPDIAAENGTIQAIDRVLIPIDIPGNEPDQELIGTNRSDDLSGAGGDDILSGLNGRDRLNGEGGDDDLNGGRGRDTLDGGSGDDDLFGGRGRDILIGGEGDDDLNGGWGQDFLVGGEGNDELTGGLGADHFDLTDLEGDDVITDLTRADTVKLSAEDFEDFEALLDATEFVDGDAVFATEAGSVRLANVDEDRFDEDSFAFV
ncbi:MAG: fasciclin domain-containing protein [Pseudomonadota bacterium]